MLSFLVLINETINSYSFLVLNLFISSKSFNFVRIILKKFSILYIKTFHFNSNYINKILIKNIKVFLIFLQLFLILILPIN